MVGSILEKFLKSFPMDFAIWQCHLWTLSGFASAKVVCVGFQYVLPPANLIEYQRQGSFIYIFRIRLIQDQYELQFKSNWTNLKIAAKVLNMKQEPSKAITTYTRPLIRLSCKSSVSSLSKSAKLYAFSKVLVYVQVNCAVFTVT